MSFLQKKLALLGFVFLLSTWFLQAQQATSFTFPLDEAAVRMDQSFGNLTQNGTYHLGEDYTALDGSELPVYAIANGTIKHNAQRTSYGHVVVIEHEMPTGNKVCSILGHLRQEGLAEVGTTVQKGQIIGYLSSDQQENGGYDFTHLHFGVRDGAYSSTWVYFGYSHTTAGWHNPSDFIANHSVEATNLNRFCTELVSVSQYPDPLEPDNYHYAEYIFRNTGSDTWKRDFVSLGTGTYSNHDLHYDIWHSSWHNPERPCYMLEEEVAPGQIATFRFLFFVKKEAETTLNKYAFTPVAENYTWMRNSDGSEIDAQIQFSVKEEAPYHLGITAPSASTKAEMGKWLTIRWSTDISASEFFKLELVKGNVVVHTFAESTINDGSLLANLPTNLTAGSDYRVKITPAFDTSLFTYSQNFTINALGINKPPSLGLLSHTNFQNVFAEEQTFTFILTDNEGIVNTNPQVKVKISDENIWRSGTNLTKIDDYTYTFQRKFDVPPGVFTVTVSGSDQTWSNTREESFSFTHVSKPKNFYRKYAPQNNFIETTFELIPGWFCWIYRSETNNAEEAELIDVVTGSSYKDYNVEGGKRYYYWGKQSPYPNNTEVVSILSDVAYGYINATLNLPITELNVGAKSTSTILEVNANNNDWTAISSNNFVLLTKVSENELLVTTAENFSPAQKNATITVQAGGSEYMALGQINVTQEGKANIGNAPSNINITDITSTSANLSWDATADAINYAIDIKELPDGSFKPLGSVNAPATTYTLTGLATETNYSVRITAINSALEQGQTEQTFTTLQAGPEAVKNLTATPDGATEILLTWEATTGTYTSDIIIGSTSEDMVLLQTVDETVTSYRAIGLEPNTTYYFKIVNKNSGGETSSETITATTLGALPTAFSITATAVSASQVDIDIDEIQNENEIILKGKVEGETDYSFEYELSENSRSYRVNGLNEATNYEFVAIAKNSTGETSSDVIAVQTLSCGSLYAIPDVETSDEFFSVSILKNQALANCLGLNIQLTIDAPQLKLLSSSLNVTNSEHFVVSENEEGNVLSVRISEASPTGTTLEANAGDAILTLNFQKPYTFEADVSIKATIRESYENGVIDYCPASAVVSAKTKVTEGSVGIVKVKPYYFMGGTKQPLLNLENGVQTQMFYVSPEGDKLSDTPLMYNNGTFYFDLSVGAKHVRMVREGAIMPDLYVLGGSDLRKTDLHNIGEITFTKNELLKVPFNDDGVISETDASKLANYIVGKENESKTWSFMKESDFISANITKEHVPNLTNVIDLAGTPDGAEVIVLGFLRGDVDESYNNNIHLQKKSDSDNKIELNFSEAEYRNGVYSVPIYSNADVIRTLDLDITIPSAQIGDLTSALEKMKSATNVLDHNRLVYCAWSEHEIVRASIDEPIGYLKVDRLVGEIENSIALVNGEKAIVTLKKALNTKQIQKEISIQNNPVTDLLFITGLQKEEDFKITNLHGQVLKTGKTTGEISVDNLRSALYLLSIRNKRIRFIKH